jgi:hypothetical protein
MLRLSFILAVLAWAVLGASCNQTACMDLCDTQMPCGAPFQCIQSHCLIWDIDAGKPPSCQ